jgi:hypothetical protein
LYTNFLPIPKKEEVVLHPERACAPGRTEADTRMILQALHADKRLKEFEKQGRIIIKTSDTDEIVLCIYLRRSCAPGRTLHVISEREEHRS